MKQFKRFEIVRFTQFQFIPNYESGFFDRRTTLHAWKYKAINFGYWKFIYNYDFTDYGTKREVR